MTSTDTILFLKETSVCKYLLVLHTPRLCGEPGFQSARQLQPAQPIHCRHVINASEAAALVYSDPQSRFPYSDTRVRDPAHLPDWKLQSEKRQKAREAKKANAAGSTSKISGKHADALKKAVSQLFGKQEGTGKKKNTANREGGDAATTGRGRDNDQVGAELVIDIDDDGNAQTMALKGEDGEDVVVQVLDWEDIGGEGANNADRGGLLDRLQEAIDAALLKTAARRSKQEQYREEDEDEDNVLYYDDTL
jgi:hypothetical protein